MSAAISSLIIPLQLNCRSEITPDDHKKISQGIGIEIILYDLRHCFFGNYNPANKSAKALVKPLMPCSVP